MFSAGFLTALVYLSLAWCAISAIGLSLLLLRDIVRGQSW